MADQKISDLSQVLTIGLADQWEVLRSGNNVRIPISVLAQLVGYPCQGRITTESGVPVSTTDRIAQSTLYFTPYNGNLIALYTASNWKLYTFTEKSLVLSGLTTGKNYDIFIYDNAGTLTLEPSNAWTNDTTRADAIVQQDGIDVKSGNTSRRLIGTIRATGTTTVEDSLAKRFMWNKYNKVLKPMQVTEPTDSWVYTTATWRQSNGNALNQIDFVIGEIQQVRGIVYGNASQNTAGVQRAVGVGVDVTNSPSGIFQSGEIGTSNTLWFSGIYVGLLAAGRHFLAALEYSQVGGTSTWHGDGGVVFQQAGIQGEILG